MFELSLEYVKESQPVGKLIKHLNSLIRGGPSSTISRDTKYSF